MILSYHSRGLLTIDNWTYGEATRRRLVQAWSEATDLVEDAIRQDSHVPNADSAVLCKAEFIELNINFYLVQCVVLSVLSTTCVKYDQYS